MSLKVPRGTLDSEFRITSLAIQNYTVPHSRVLDECVWVGGYFHGVAVVKNRAEADAPDIVHLGRWCRSLNVWQSALDVPQKISIQSMAASANGEVIAGWDGGFGVWNHRREKQTIFDKVGDTISRDI